MKRIFVKIILLVVLSAVFVFPQKENEKISWLTNSAISYNLFFTAQDSSIVCKVTNYLNNGIQKVESYFERPFPNKFDVYVFPSRKSLDEQWSKDWRVPDFKSECWMIASGVAHRLDMLSLSTWKSDACEHDPENKGHVQKLITHELVHVFHGQHNPIPDFTGMDDLGWFVEGLAVLVSGQLDSARIKDLSEAKKLNKLPSELEQVWNGKYRYVISGSLVRFVQNKWGEEFIRQLMKCSKEEEILKILNTNENKLLDEWKKNIN